MQRVVCYVLEPWHTQHTSHFVLTKANITSSACPFVDLDIYLTEGRFNIRDYEKRYDFSFAIVNVHIIFAFIFLLLYYNYGTCICICMSFSFCSII